VSQQAVPQAVVPTGQVHETWPMRTAKKRAIRESCILKAIGIILQLDWECKRRTA
jgi:hypothetical protein